MTSSPNLRPGWIGLFLILMMICFSSEDEESKWLDALESGDLDDYGRLKKEKDVSLMTARQVSKITVSFICKAGSMRLS